MPKQALLLVHGMGTFVAPGKDEKGNLTLGDFGKEFIEATTEALQRYEKHSKETLAIHVEPLI